MSQKHTPISQETADYFNLQARQAREVMELRVKVAELVEALEELRRAYPHDVRTSGQHEAWTKALAAIKKARGTQ